MQKTCCICGAMMTEHRCRSCEHLEREQCPIDIPRKTYQELEAENARLKAEREELRTTLKLSHEALDEMCEWHGATHEADCPEDDTCDCLHKAFNDRVNKACQVADALLDDAARAALGRG